MKNKRKTERNTNKSQKQEKPQKKNKQNKKIIKYLDKGLPVFLECSAAAVATVRMCKSTASTTYSRVRTKGCACIVGGGLI